MASAVVWSGTFTKAIGGRLAGRLTVIEVMQAAKKPRPNRKSPTLTGVQKSGMPVTARRISKSVTSAVERLVPQRWGSSTGDHVSSVVRLGARPTVVQAPPPEVEGVVAVGVRPTGVVWSAGRAAPWGAAEVDGEPTAAALGGAAGGREVAPPECGWVLPGWLEGSGEAGGGCLLGLGWQRRTGQP